MTTTTALAVPGQVAWPKVLDDHERNISKSWDEDFATYSPTENQVVRQRQFLEGETYKSAQRLADEAIQLASEQQQVTWARAVLKRFYNLRNDFPREDYACDMIRLVHDNAVSIGALALVLEMLRYRESPWPPLEGEMWQMISKAEERLRALARNIRNMPKRHDWCLGASARERKRDEEAQALALLRENSKQHMTSYEKWLHFRDTNRWVYEQHDDVE